MNQIQNVNKQLKNINKVKEKLPVLKENKEESREGRKFESHFVTAVLSRIGQQEENRDYSGYIELENYSCWVVSSGIRNAKAAQIVTEEVMKEFIKKPKFSRRYLKKIIRKAELKIASIQEKAKEEKGIGASIAVVISDYKSIMMESIGNARAVLIRDGLVYEKTADDTMAYLFYLADKLEYDGLRFHGLRDDLTQYIGNYRRVKVKPKRKTVLEEGDKILLLTKGAWENLDESDIEIELSKSNGVGKWIGSIENRIKDNSRGKLENYTMIGIFINRTAIIKRNYKALWLKVMGVILIMSLLAHLSYRGYKVKKELNVQHQQIKANEKLVEKKLETDDFEAAIDLLKKNEKQYEKLETSLENSSLFKKIILTPELLSYSYEDQLEYIEIKISDIEKLKIGSEKLRQGNIDYTNNEFENSKTLYEESLIELNKIEKINYNKLQKLKSELQEKLEKTKVLIAGENLKKQADDYVKGNNVPAAIRTYLEAKLVFMKYDEIELVSEINTKVELLTKEREKKYQKAENYEKRGIRSEAIDIDEAILHYKMAKSIYLELGEESRRDEMAIKISDLEELKKVLKEKNERFYNDARLHIENKEYDAAVTSLKESKKVAEKLKSDQLVVNSLEKEGDVFFVAEDYEASKLKYQEAYEKVINIKNDYQKMVLENKIKMLEVLLTGKTLEELGDTLYAQKKYKESKGKYNDSKITYEYLKGNNYLPPEKYDELILNIEEKEKKAWKESNWIPFF